MTSNFTDVGDFHHKFGLPAFPSLTEPKPLDPELLRFRIRFLEEELEEFKQASEQGDPVEQFDALLDLVYVAMGTAHLLGFPWQEGWDEVQRSNMAKVRAASDGTDSKRGSSYDVVKPAGWTPPNLRAILKGAGW